MSMESMPPPDLLMQISNSASQEDFSSSFPHVRDEVGNYLHRTGHRLNEFEAILDFGCGVGRFAYAVKPILAGHQKLYGCDLDAACASWCAQHVGYEQVVQNALQPGLPWADNSFDFIYALSVFTHLSMEHQFPWAWELCRVLKPNGILMFSTHGLGQLMPGLLGGAWSERHAFLVNGEGLITTLGRSNDSRLEGQREVAAFHNREALIAQFRSLSMDLHDPVSTMAGGQSMSILSKSDTSVWPATVDTGFKTRDAGVLTLKAEKANRGADFCGYFEPASVIFNVDGYQAVARSADDETTIIGRGTFPVVASHGKNHFLELRFRLACDPDQRVEIAVLDRSGDVVAGQWHFPHWLGRR